MVYQDAEKACGLMTSVSKEAEALAGTLSPDQISAFVQNVMDNIVINLLKDTVVRNGLTVVKNASRQQLQELHDAVSGQEGFLVPSLAGILETSLAIVNCRSVTAMALARAITSVETYSEMPLDEQGPSQSLILQFFVTKGAGENLFTIASGQLAEREDEIINERLVMENIQKSQAFKEECQRQMINKILLEELLKHVDSTTALLTRTKQQKPLNRGQRECVEEEFEQLQTLVTSKVKDSLNERVLRCILLSQDALEKDSVAVSDRGEEKETGTVSDQDQKQGIAGHQAGTSPDQDAGELGIVIKGSPVTLVQIQEILAGQDVCIHRIWQRGEFKDLRPFLASYEDHSAKMYNILEYSLTRLKVFQQSRPTIKFIGAGSLIETLPKVEAWMRAMGWKEDAVCQWKTVFAQPILDDANGHLDETYGHIKSAIGSVLEGRSYSDEEVKELIAPVPDPNFKKVFSTFFSAWACLKKNKEAGSHCSVEDQRLCESKIASLLRWWPKNKLELFEKCGLDGALKQTVDGWNTELRSLRTSRVSELAEAVNAKTFKAEIILKGVQTMSNSEGPYCAHMKKHGSQVAQMQKELNQIRNQIKSEFPDIETSKGGGTAFGQDGMAVSGEAQQEETGGAAFDKLKTLYEECKACEDALYYFTSMYVGLTLLRTPSAASTASPAHGHLKQVV